MLPQYEMEHTYPDLLDLKSVLRSLGSEQEITPRFFQEFRAAHEWLQVASQVCHSHGKHYPTSAVEIKQVTEKLLQDTLSDEAFRAALFITGYIKMGKAAKTPFRDLEVKFPPLNREDEIARRWGAYHKD